MRYEARVKFFFTENFEGEPDRDSEKFVIEAASYADAFMKSFKKVIENWDENSIGITSVELV